MTQDELTEEAIDYSMQLEVITWEDSLIQSRMITNAFEAGFKKALELVLEDNIKKMQEAVDYYSHGAAKEAVLGFIFNNFSKLID